MRDAALRRALPLLMALSGFALLGSSVEGVSAIDTELRSSVRAVPVDERDCPDDRPARGPEV